MTINQSHNISANRLNEWNEWKPEGFSKAGYKVELSKNAMKTYLSAKLGYEQTMLAKGINALLSTPFPQDGKKHVFYPTSWRKKRDPGIAGAYEISYIASPGKLRITKIRYDVSLFGPKPGEEHKEISALYEIRKTNRQHRFDEKTTQTAHIENLKNSWDQGKVSREVKTTYAAVNGMLNEFDKARWLMGTHLEWAYKEDANNINQYTLFHNQSEGPLKDLFECASD